MPRGEEIEHVVLLMLENRSFDHILGDLKRSKPALEGIDPARPNKNAYGGQDFLQEPGAARIVSCDPKHERTNVAVQLGNNNGGFVTAYAQEYPDLRPDALREVMRYHAEGTLPALHTLAQNFMVCDHWHASVPGPTWPNRLFALSGTSLGRVKMPEGPFNWNFHWYDQTTLFDRLNDKNIDWRVYCGDAPLSLLFAHQLEPRNAVRHRPFQEFITAAAGDEAEFPPFTLVEPSYFSPHANDDHPPHDILAGQSLIAMVYNSLRANEALWNKTLLVVLYDEHGGFYDHVVPPKAVPPDHHSEEYTFDQYGLRVPAILVSPWVDNGVLSNLYDHTSLLKFLIDKWRLGPLGDRTASANVFTGAFLDEPRTNTPASIKVALPAPEIVTVPQPVNLAGNQAAIVGLSHAIESVSGDAPEVITERLRRSLTGPQGQADAALERFESFLGKMKDDVAGVA